MAMSETTRTAAPQPATWRKVVAAILDFVFVLFAAGYAVG
jgi:hypothetical protein